MRMVTVSMRRLKSAIARAKTVSDDWQAECCEIALIPAVAKRWAELNAPRLPRVHLVRHEGLPHVGMSPDENRAIGDKRQWDLFAGYVLKYGYADDVRISWNSVGSDGYSHSPGCAWDGMRRETISQFIHDLRMIALGYDHPEILSSVARAKIRVSVKRELVTA